MYSQYFGAQYSPYSEYSELLRCLYSGYCLYSRIRTAHTSNIGVFGPSVLLIIQVLISCRPSVRKYSHYSEYVKNSIYSEYRVYSEHLSNLSPVQVNSLNIMWSIRPDPPCEVCLLIILHPTNCVPLHPAEDDKTEDVPSPRDGSGVVLPPTGEEALEAAALRREC